MIRFYIGCNITTEYKNTYRTDALRKYLNTLSHYDIDDSNIYLRFNGRLQFNLNVPFVYDYANYIQETKIINNIPTNYYYIVTKWEIVNNCLIIEYVIDYFHTFYFNWEIKRSCLRFTGKPNENRPYALPLGYELKNQCFGVSLPNELANRTIPGLEDYVVVVEGYFYTLVDKGDSEISQFCGILSIGGDVPNAQRFSYERTALYKAISNAVKRQNDKRPLPYRITKLYMFPAVMVSDELAKQYMSASYLALYNRTSSEETTESLGILVMSFGYGTVMKSKVSYGNYVTNEGNNYYQLAYGTPLHQFTIPNDGLEHEISVKMSISRYVGFSMIMYGINEVVDITDDFKIDVNFDTVTADVIAQRDANTEYRLMSGVIKAGTSLIGSMKGGYTESSGSYMSSTTFDMSRSSNAVEGVLMGMQNVVYSVTPRFNTYIEASNTSGDIVNTYFGLMSYVGEIENITEVNNKLNKYGYIVDYDINLKSELYKYLNSGQNFVKFSEFEIEGALPSQFIEAIQNIFLRGTFFNY